MLGVGAVRQPAGGPEWCGRVGSARHGWFDFRFFQRGVVGLSATNGFFLFSKKEENDSVQRFCAPLLLGDNFVISGWLVCRGCNTFLFVSTLRPSKTKNFGMSHHIYGHILEVLSIV